MGVSKNNGTPKSSILIGFSIIFTIHFGAHPYFGVDTRRMEIARFNGIQSGQIFQTTSRTDQNRPQFR